MLPPGSSTCCSGEKKYAEVEQLLRTAITRDPDNPALNSQLASTFTYEGSDRGNSAILGKTTTP